MSLHTIYMVGINNVSVHIEHNLLLIRCFHSQSVMQDEFTGHIGSNDRVRHNVAELRSYSRRINSGHLHIETKIT